MGPGLLHVHPAIYEPFGDLRLAAPHQFLEPDDGWVGAVLHQRLHKVEPPPLDRLLESRVLLALRQNSLKQYLHQGVKARMDRDAKRRGAESPLGYLRPLPGRDPLLHIEETTSAAQANEIGRILWNLVAAIGHKFSIMMTRGNINARHLPAWREGSDASFGELGGSRPPDFYHPSTLATEIFVLEAPDSALITRICPSPLPARIS
jgi:hypothetical protein